MYLLGVFVSCCLECNLVVVVVFHHWLKSGLGQNLHYLVLMILIVGVLNSMEDFGMERVVVDVLVGWSIWISSS